MKAIFYPMSRGVIKSVVIFCPTPQKEFLGSSNHSFYISNTYTQSATTHDRLWTNKYGYIVICQIVKIKIGGKIPLKGQQIHANEHVFCRSIARIFPLDFKYPTNGFTSRINAKRGVMPEMKTKAR